MAAIRSRSARSRPSRSIHSSWRSPSRSGLASSRSISRSRPSASYRRARGPVAGADRTVGSWLSGAPREQPPREEPDRRSRTAGRPSRGRGALPCPDQPCGRHQHARSDGEASIRSLRCVPGLTPGSIEPRSSRACARGADPPSQIDCRSERQRQEPADTRLLCRVARTLSAHPSRSATVDGGSRVSGPIGSPGAGV